jgi:hypothetical protein
MEEKKRSAICYNEGTFIVEFLTGEVQDMAWHFATERARRKVELARSMAADMWVACQINRPRYNE